MTFSDDGTMLDCPHGCASLLLSEYHNNAYEPRMQCNTLARYSEWLPGPAAALDAALPRIMHLPWFNTQLGCDNVYFALSGTWPRYDVYSRSGSFKDIEAATVLARMRLAPHRTVALASAGNTALAFALAATYLDQPCIIVVTEETHQRLRIPHALGDNVHCVVLGAPAQYDDAIIFARSLAADPRITLEGGVKNIGRRDGVGTVILAAFDALGAMPDTYVQGVGSAAGAIAVTETAERLRSAGQTAFLPRLLLAQNAPYTPLVRSWSAGSSRLLQEDEVIARKQIQQIAAPVLSNIRPPYEVAGGIHQCLQRTDASIVAVTNADIVTWQAHFWAHERVLIEPAAAAAVAAFANSVGDSRKKSTTLIHLTGALPLTSDRPFSARSTVHVEYHERHDASLAMRILDQVLT